MSIHGSLLSVLIPFGLLDIMPLKKDNENVDQIISDMLSILRWCDALTVRKQKVTSDKTIDETTRSRRLSNLQQAKERIKQGLKSGIYVQEGPSLRLAKQSQDKSTNDNAQDSPTDHERADEDESMDVDTDPANHDTQDKPPKASDSIDYTRYTERTLRLAFASQPAASQPKPESVEQTIQSAETSCQSRNDDAQALLKARGLKIIRLEFDLLNARKENERLKHLVEERQQSCQRTTIPSAQAVPAEVGPLVRKARQQVGELIQRFKVQR